MSVDSPQILAQSFIRHFSKFAGKVDMKIKVRKIHCLDEFYVMPLGGMMNKIISRTPGQRKYQAALEWDKDVIIFKQQDVM